MAKLIWKNAHRRYLILGVVFAVLVVDQLTKIYARDVIATMAPMSFLADTVRISHTQNRGAFLSLGAGLHDNARFGIFTIAVAIFLIYMTFNLFRKENDRLATIALSLFISGGIGNLIDRVMFGSVTDFMNVGFGPIRTGIFNVADVAIIAGLLILIYHSFVSRPAEA